ncbi:MAG: DoxX family protein [Rhabdochlamydiaceae bacterium]
MFPNLLTTLAILTPLAGTIAGSSIASLILRVYFGITMMLHGYPKVTKGRHGTAEWIKRWGFREMWRSRLQSWSSLEAYF